MPHTLSLFPSLFDYQLFAPLILRIAVGVFLFLIGFDSVRKKKAAAIVNEDSSATSESPADSTSPTKKATDSFVMIFGIVALLLSVCIILGAFTQGTALLVIILIVLNSISRGRLLDTSGTSGDALLLILIMCIALLLLGAGTPAVDLPL
jgi:uncharacterized membrane protein YphA (DoxX/SURF4 family)